MIYQIVWGGLLLFFAVLEGLTAGLVSIWFCVGALGALIVSMVGGNVIVQAAVFVILSLVCMALIRPLAKNRLIPHTQATNADRIVGAEAVVKETIDNLAATGQVQVDGKVWTARSEGEESIPVGETVRVLRIEGVKAIVAWGAKDPAS